LPKREKNKRIIWIDYLDDLKLPPNPTSSTKLYAAL